MCERYVFLGLHLMETAWTLLSVEGIIWLGVGHFVNNTIPQGAFRICLWQWVCVIVILSSG